jgi:hypothetical protein
MTPPPPLSFSTDHCSFMSLIRLVVAQSIFSLIRHNLPAPVHANYASASISSPSFSVSCRRLFWFSSYLCLPPLLSLSSSLPISVFLPSYLCLPPFLSLSSSPPISVFLPSYLCLPPLLSLSSSPQCPYILSLSFSYELVSISPSLLAVPLSGTQG